MRADSKRNGFTLLEVTVSLALTAVVLGILLTAVRLTENARQRVEVKLNAMAQRLSMMEAVQVQIGSAVPRVFTTNSEQQPLRLLSFQGTAKQIRFLTHSSWTGERNVGQWLATYQVVKQPHGLEQVMISESSPSGAQQLVTAMLATDTPATPTQPWGDPADRIEFSYLQPSLPGTPAAWVIAWKADEQKQLPWGVQVHWWRGKREQVLDFIIPVRAEEAQ